MLAFRIIASWGGGGGGGGGVDAVAQELEGRGQGPSKDNFDGR